MLTVKDLGKIARQLDPKKATHLTDEEIGRATKRAAEARGSREYDKYKDVALTSPVNSTPQIVQKPQDNFNQLTRDLVGNEKSLLMPKGLEQKVEQIISEFNPSSGWLSSWTGGKRTARQREMAENLTAIESQVIDQYLMYADKMREGKMREIDFKRFVAENVVALMSIQALSKRIEAAAEQLLPVEQFDNLQYDKLYRQQDFELTKQQQEFELELEIKKARALSNIRIDEAVEIEERLEEMRNRSRFSIAQQEWIRFKNEKNLEIQVAILANVQELGEVAALTSSLMQTIEQIRELKALPSADHLIDKIEALDSIKDNMRKAIDDKFEVLLKRRTT